MKPLPSPRMEVLPLRPDRKTMPLPNIKVPAPSNSNYWSVNPESGKNRKRLDLENTLNNYEKSINEQRRPFEEQKMKVMRDKVKEITGKGTPSGKTVY
jgi:hypothetical protein